MAAFASANLACRAVTFSAFAAFAITPVSFFAPPEHTTKIGPATSAYLLQPSRPLSPQGPWSTTAQCFSYTSLCWSLASGVPDFPGAYGHCLPKTRAGSSPCQFLHAQCQHDRLGTLPSLP